MKIAATLLGSIGGLGAFICGGFAGFGYVLESGSTEGVTNTLSSWCSIEMLFGLVVILVSGFTYPRPKLAGIVYSISSFYTFGLVFAIAQYEMGKSYQRIEHFDSLIIFGTIGLLLAIGAFLSIRSARKQSADKLLATPTATPI